MITFGDAIQSLRPDSKWTLPNASDLATLIWPSQAQTRPTNAEIMNEIARLDLAQTDGDTRTASFKADAGRVDLLTRLRTATPAQIDTWVDANVTTLPQARTVFKAIIKVIALDART